MIAQDHRQRPQRAAQFACPIRRGAPVIAIAGGAQHQGGGAGFLGIAGQCDRLALAGRVPEIEALQRVDGEYRDARLVGLFAQRVRRGAVGQRHAIEVIADLHRRHAKPMRQRRQFGEVGIGRGDVVERVWR